MVGLLRAAARRLVAILVLGDYRRRYRHIQR
jgi:hypothetical protein